MFRQLFAMLDFGTWAMLLVIAFYLFRGARAGKKAGSVLGRAVMYAIIVLVSFGLAAAMSWADLHVSKFVVDAKGAIEVGLRLLGEHLDSVLSEQVLR